MYTFLYQPEPDLYAGLALEEALLDSQEQPHPVLLLWRSPAALVLGKNQNPWKECDLARVRDQKLLLGRRVSGGGTVYHDPGNLNLAWVMERGHYSAESLHAWLRDALGLLGLEAVTNSSGATFVQGRKISGSAYCYRRKRVLHHATLLLDADLQTLNEALRPPALSLNTHAIASIPAPVANLLDLKPGLSENVLTAALHAAAAKSFGECQPGNTSGLVTPKALETLRSPEWIWGQTPAFTLSLNVEGNSIDLHVRKGKVIHINGNGTDPLPFDHSLPASLAARLSLPVGEVDQAFSRGGWVWMT